MCMFFITFLEKSLIRDLQIVCVFRMSGRRLGKSGRNLSVTSFRCPSLSTFFKSLSAQPNTQLLRSRLIAILVVLTVILFKKARLLLWMLLGRHEFRWSRVHSTYLEILLRTLFKRNRSFGKFINLIVSFKSLA